MEAVLVSGIVRIALNFLSASVRLRWMGAAVDPDYRLPEPPAGQLQQLQAIKRALARCVRYVPWNTECYTQALTARILLRRRSIPLLLIVGFKAADGQSLQGHAWTICGSYIITGYRTDLGHYSINGCFL
ncbi:MAG: lasso peptide biosynthesis B2 protein [Sphingomonadales bacterium]